MNGEREPVDPRDFQTFDQFDPSIEPPEVPEEFEADPRGVPSNPVYATVGILSAAYNER